MDGNQRVSQIAAVSETVAKDIATVNQTAGDIASGSEQVLTNAAELSRLAEELQQMVGRFKTGEDIPGSNGGACATSSHEAIARSSASGPSLSHRAQGRPFIEWNETGHF